MQLILYEKVDMLFPSQKKNVEIIIYFILVAAWAMGFSYGTLMQSNFDMGEGFALDQPHRYVSFIRWRQRRNSKVLKIFDIC